MLFILKSLFPTRPFSLTWTYISHSLLDISKSTSSLNLVYPPKFTDQALAPVPAQSPKSEHRIPFLSPHFLPLHLTSSQSPSPADFDENFTASPHLPVTVTSASSLLTLLLSLHICTDHSSSLPQTHHSPRF